jgi:ATP phosphoribosyltransferase regulatory subunit
MGVQRVYYNENVYRVSDNTHSFKEIMQAGLECLGDVSTYDLCEVLLLATESLQAISNQSVLNLSHLGIVETLLEKEEFRGIRKEVLGYIGEKNIHEITRVCTERGIGKATIDALCYLCQGYGTAEQVLAGLEPYKILDGVQQAVEELKMITTVLAKTTKVPVLIDLSLVSNTNYYNGLVFRGYVKDIPTDVLRGGQYDKLMKRLGKPQKAIGFAVYLDMLDRLEDEPDYDVDTVLLYDDTTSLHRIRKVAAELSADGQRVLVQSTLPEGIRYRKLVTLHKEEVLPNA